MIRYIYTLVDGGRQGFSLTYCWYCATKLSVYEKEEILTTGQLWAGCSMSVWVKTNRRPSSVLLRYATCKYWIIKPLYRTVCNMTVISYVSPATSSSNAAIYLWFTLWIIYYSYFNNDHNNTVQTKITRWYSVSYLYIERYCWNICVYSVAGPHDCFEAPLW